MERKHEQLKEQVHQMRQQTATILKNISLTEQKIKLEKNYLNLKKSNIQTIGERFQDYKVSRLNTIELNQIKGIRLAKSNKYQANSSEIKEFFDPVISAKF